MTVSTKPPATSFAPIALTTESRVFAISKHLDGDGRFLRNLHAYPGHTARGARETAIYVLSGEVHTWHDDELEQPVVAKAGDLFYIPAGVPHLPANLSDKPSSAVITRTDPNEQESVVLLPHLDGRGPA